MKNLLFITLSLLFATAFLYSLFIFIPDYKIRNSESMPIPTDTVLSSEELTALVNDWRESQGLQPYLKDDRLCVIAKDRIKSGKDDHKGLYEKYSVLPYTVQENSVWNADTEIAALESWLGSPRHLETLKKTYKYSCISTERQNALQIFSNF